MSALTGDLLKEAVHHHCSTTRTGVLERLFTLWFRGFVYNQIWEDPRVDVVALELDHRSRVLTISSGGCNVLNYLVHRPARIVAIDLNGAHLSLMRLKLAAIRGLSDYEDFFQFFGVARGAENIRRYDRGIRGFLDDEARGFWDGCSGLGRSRIGYFERGFYDHAKLGLFLRLMHRMFRVMGGDPKGLLTARTRADQDAFFDAEVAPFFDQGLVRWLSQWSMTVFGLGIPPRQHRVLYEECGGALVTLFRERLRRLVCDFPIWDNYFAWQAFGRCYDCVARRAVPDYLKREHYDTLRQGVSRVETHVTSLLSFLKSQPDRSLDKFVLLDSQDWMPPEAIAALWREIARVGMPGSHIIFRTAGVLSPVESALPSVLRRRFAYCLAQSQALHARDRSAIYGMFHLYYLVY